MAQKRINDLQLRSDFDETCNFPSDDLVQTWRVTGQQVLDFVKDDISADTAMIAEIREWTYRAVSAPSSEAIAATDRTLSLSGASGIVVLPTAVGRAGKQFTIYHGGTSDSQKYTINTTSSQTVGGYASGALKLVTNGEAITVESDGANWIIVSHKIKGDWVSCTVTGAWANTTYTALKRREKNGYRYKVKAVLTGTPTNTPLIITLPATDVINNATSEWAIAPVADQEKLGDLKFSDLSDTGIGKAYTGLVVYNSTTAVKLVLGYTYSGNTYLAQTEFTTTVPFTWTTGDFLHAEFFVPIVDMKG